MLVETRPYFLLSTVTLSQRQHKTHNLNKK